MSLPQTPAAQRLTLVDSIGTPADGESLSGQNVNAFPEGALFYVRAVNRFYRLKKGLPSTVTPGGAGNVVSGIGSTVANGAYFVAVQQQGTFTLVGGTAAVVGLDLSTTGYFLTSVITIGGTVGVVHGAVTNDHTATFTSNQGADTSTMGFIFVETGAEA